MPASPQAGVSLQGFFAVGLPSTPAIKNSLRCACFAARSAPIAVGSLIPRRRHRSSAAANRGRSFRTPFAAALAFWLSESTLISGWAFELCLAAFHTDSGRRDRRSLMITTLFLAVQAVGDVLTGHFLPASVLSEVIRRVRNSSVASYVNRLITYDPGLFRAFTAGPIPL